MTREIHDIPPAPRKVRLRAVLWHRWPLAFAGFVLGVYGGLITLMLILAHGGKPADDRLLDAAGVAVDAVVTAVEGGDDRPTRPVYVFTANGREWTSRAFLADPALRAGSRIRVEYLPGRPQINRPVGGRISMVPPLHRISVWFFLTGVACGLVWLFGVLRLRHLMQHGDMAVGEIHEARRIPYVMPTMLRVSYSFRNHHAREQAATHWVRARSELGERIASNPRKIAVLHSRSGQGVSRLVMASDFVAEPAPNDPGPT